MKNSLDDIRWDAIQYLLFPLKGYRAVLKDRRASREISSFRELGIESFKWYGFDCILDPRVPDNKIVFFDGLDRPIIVFEIT